MFLVLVLLLVGSVPSLAGGKSIYGQDDRIDYYQASAELRLLSDSVVSLWRPEWLTESGDAFTIFRYTLGKAKKLCPGERFSEQNVGAFCSGTLVGDDLILTAGHCVKDMASCADTRFVFGYRVSAPDHSGVHSVPKKDVYSCAAIELLRFKPGNRGMDYALVRLDRRVDGHLPLMVSRSSGVLEGEDVFAIGHPTGLPLKIAAGAKVRNSYGEYFVADLDTFTGNSGSPVFSQRTGQVEGILVRGGDDYVETASGCYMAVKYAQGGGKGEDVIKSSLFRRFIPDLPAQAGRYVSVAPVARGDAKSVGSVLGAPADKISSVVFR